MALVLVFLILNSKKMKKIFLLIVLISFVGCKKKETKSNDVKLDSTEQNVGIVDSPTINPEIKKESLKQINDEILQSLKTKNYKHFAEFIHPEKGLRFSMYAFVNPNEDKHFSKSDFQKYQPTKTIFTWGARDGSGELYKATINQYLTDWVFVKDFAKSTYSLNEFQGGGNSLNNLKEIYPNKDFTENFIKGTEKYGDMDWNTLRFVFEQFEGKYYIIAVINDRWTI